MAETLSSFTITQQGWIDVSALTGIIDGTALVIQNQSSSQFFLAISQEEPSDTFRGLIIPSDISVMSRVDAGEPRVWIKGSGRINIQEG